MSTEVNGEAAAWLQRFIDHITLERRLSPYTVRNYSKALESFLKWLCEEARWNGQFNTISLRQVKGFIIEKQQTLSRRTIHNHVSGMRTFFKFLRQNGLIEGNPVNGLHLPRLEKPLPKFLTEEQMYRLLAGPMSLLEKEQIKPFEAWRDRLAMELLYGGGLRISELVALNYGAIDFSAGIARIVGKGGKERMCPLGKVAIACLEKFRNEFAPMAGRDDPVLVGNKHTRWYPRAVQKKMKKYLSLAGLPMDMSPHKIRHSYATHLLDHGADLRLLQELLGHAKLSTTQVYTHVGIGRLQEAHRQAHPRA